MLKKWINEYIKINKKEILITIGLLLLGIIIGIGIYLFFSSATKELAITSVKEVFDISKESTYIKTNIIANGVKADLILILIISMASVTLFGKWIIYLIITLKGISLSIYTILLFNVFGPLWGILVAILLVVLVNIIYIPALICLVVNFLNINFNIFKININTLNMIEIYKVLLVVFFCFVVMFSSIILEQIASPIVLSIYNSL